MKNINTIELTAGQIDRLVMDLGYELSMNDYYSYDYKSKTRSQWIMEKYKEIIGESAILEDLSDIIIGRD